MAATVGLQAVGAPAVLDTVLLLKHPKWRKPGQGPYVQLSRLSLRLVEAMATLDPLRAFVGAGDSYHAFACDSCSCRMGLALSLSGHLSATGALWRSCAL